METILKKMMFEVKNWWLSLLLGLLFIGFSILLLFTPLKSYIALSVAFSIMMFVSGLFEIVFAVKSRKCSFDWGWYLAAGIIDLLIGAYLISNPGLSMVIIPYIVALWLMFKGFSGIGSAVSLQRYGSNDWGWALFIGILAILCSIAIIWNPVAGALSVVFITSFAFMFVGALRIAFSLQLRKLYKRIKQD